MTMNGKQDDFTLDDFRACARAAAMKRGRAEAIVGEVREVVSRWQQYATVAGVPDAWREKIQGTLRLQAF
jgi:serine/threonine-protein kinase HipA